MVNRKINDGAEPKSAAIGFCSNLFIHIWELMKLSVVFLLFSLPIVTVFAAYGAAVSCLGKLGGEKMGRIFRCFWAHFRKAWLPDSLTGIGCALVVYASCFSGTYYWVVYCNSAVGYLIPIIFGLLLLWAVCAFLFFCCIRASVVLPFRSAIRNALLLPLIFPGTDVIFVLSLGAALLLCILCPALLIFAPLWLMVYSYFCFFLTVGKIKALMLPTPDSAD